MIANQYVTYGLWLFTAVPALVAVGYVAGLALNRFVDWADQRTRTRR